MLRFGPVDGPIVVVALPLFEEANRVRALSVTICRALARRGIGSILPDVPGQGESLVPLAECGLVDFREGIANATRAGRADGRACYGIAIRSGALLDTTADLRGRWHFAPQNGASLVRDLKRIKQAATQTGSVLGDRWYGEHDGPVEIAGNEIASDVLRALPLSEPSSDEAGGFHRVVRLDTDAKPADRHITGAPPWRRAEPDMDPALARLLADDVADWIDQCEG